MAAKPVNGSSSPPVPWAPASTWRAGWEPSSSPAGPPLLGRRVAGLVLAEDVAALVFALNVAGAVLALRRVVLLAGEAADGEGAAAGAQHHAEYEHGDDRQS